MARKERQPWLDTRKGTYYAFWYDRSAEPRPRVRRVSLRTTDPAKARLRFAAFLTEGGMSEIGPRNQSAELTCGQALEDYWREHVQKKNTHPDKERRYIDYLLAHFGRLPVRSASATVVLPDGRLVTQIDLYCEKRAAGVVGGQKRKKASAGPTHRRELSVLVAALNHAVRYKRVGPTGISHIPLPDAAPPKDWWLSKTELAALFVAAKNHYEAGEDKSHLSRIYKFVLLSYYTASRRNAIETLTYFQVDTKTWKRINLDKPGAKVTTKRRPVVPITAALLSDLKRMYDERTSNYVLDTPRPVYPAFMRVVAKAGLTGVSPHTLRHTRATHLLQHGVSPWEVAGLLGDTLQTVVRVYGHHCPDHLSEIMKADIGGWKPGAKSASGE